MARVRAQIEAVEEQTARGAEGARETFRLVVVQTELERVKFLVRGFLRARIAKIDAHPLHVLLTHTALLSPSELHYARHHQSLLAAHYSASFLASFPPQLQRLDDAAAGGVSMVSTPDPDTAVFCRVLRDVGEVLVEGTDAAFEMRRGDVYVVRWSAVREVVLNGDVELI
ncbi:hypothetical protein LTR04_002438 [Oleoguttula sp. CCFEE 6159]|nr:hypothetical protein LTR04_002438 [Oleoguttula sp. CCFEE 6159]